MIQKIKKLMQKHENKKIWTKIKKQNQVKNGIGKEKTKKLL
jgi:hypothetical protein